MSDLTLYQSKQLPSELSLGNLQIAKFAIEMAVNPNAMTLQAEMGKAVIFCLESGLPISFALCGGVGFIGGRLVIESKTITYALRQHPRYNYIDIETNSDESTIAITYDGEEVGRASFTRKEAETITQGGKRLIDKDNYRNYPSDMFFARAINRAYRRYAGDLFANTVYIQDEIVDVTPKRTAQPVQPSMNELGEKYGYDNVLETMQRFNNDMVAVERDLWERANPQPIDNEFELTEHD